MVKAAANPDIIETQEHFSQVSSWHSAALSRDSLSVPRREAAGPLHPEATEQLILVALKRIRAPGRGEDIFISFSSLHVPSAGGGLPSL